jgi:hypothetical protein
VDPDLVNVLRIDVIEPYGPQIVLGVRQRSRRWTDLQVRRVGKAWYRRQSRDYIGSGRFLRKPQAKAHRKPGPSNVIGVKLSMQQIQELYVKVAAIELENPFYGAIAPANAQALHVNVSRKERVSTGVFDPKLLRREIDRASEPPRSEKQVHSDEVEERQSYEEPDRDP